MPRSGCKSLCYMSILLFACPWFAAVFPIMNLDAGESMEAAGLVSRGTVWELSDERQLRELASALTENQRKYLEEAKKIQRVVESNRQAWRTAQLQLKQINNRLASIDRKDPRRKALERQREAIQRASIAPVQLAATAKLKSLLQQQCVQQCELLISVHQIQEGVASLEARYATLRKDASLAAELTQLNARLGPQRPLAALLKVANDVGRPVSTDVVPMWLEGSDARFSAIANETSPLSLTYDAEAQYFQITWADADRLGLKILPGQPVRKQNDRGQKFSLKPSSIEYLRFGSRVLRDCEVWVLPAEAEYLGTRIGHASFGDTVPQVEPEWCRIRMVAP